MRERFVVRTEKKRWGSWEISRDDLCVREREGVGVGEEEEERERVRKRIFVLGEIKPETYCQVSLASETLLLTQKLKRNR